MSPGTIIWTVLFLAIGAAGTWCARVYALRRQLLDLPGERRSHVAPTPRGGGIAIALAVVVALLALAVRMPSQIVLIVAALVGLLLVAGIGWLDDHRPLPAWPRLMIHLFSAMLLAAGFWLSGAPVSVALLVLLAAVVLINVWNFMDGIDGLAASQAGLVVIAMMMCANGTIAVHLGLALLAAIFGFLPFNLPRARIFLGDVGSGALGYLLALMIGLAAMATPVGTWPLLLLPVSAFLLDAGLTLATRILRGERWWTPHVEHAYQRSARRVGGHGPVTLGYGVWTGLALVVMAWRWGDAPESIRMTVLLWIGIGSVVWYWLRTRPETPGSQHGSKQGNSA